MIAEQGRSERAQMMKRGMDLVDHSEIWMSINFTIPALTS
jgi:hypothetical protein